MPRVTVIIPNYNHARFLDQRLRSVLEQTLEDIEIILLDDASTDDSRQVITRYEGHPSIRIVLNEHNSGSACHQWNRGVALATAPYVWIAEADDVAEPDLLATLIARLEAKPAAVLAYAQSWLIDEHGQRTGDLNEWTTDLSTDRWRQDFINDGHDECASFLMVKNTIPNASAVVFRRDAYLRADGAHEGMRLCGDWMTWARLLLQGEVSFVARHLNHFRLHTNSVRSTTSAFQQVAESLDVSRFISEQVPLTAAEQRRASCAVQTDWWAALRYHPSPSIATLLHSAKVASHLGTWLPVKLLVLTPLARLARSSWMQPMLRAKRKLTA